MNGCFDKGIWIFLICATIFWAVKGASSIYFPVRLYNTGVDTIVSVNENERQIFTVTRIDSSYGYKRYVTDSFPYFQIKILNNSIKAEVSYNRGKDIQKGDLVHVFINKKLKTGVYLGDHHGNLFNLFFYYHDEFPVVYIILDLLVIAIFITAFIINTGMVVETIVSEQTVKIQKENNIIVKAGMYAKAFLPFISYLLFTTFFFLLLIKAVYAVEQTSEFLAGFIFLLCLVIVVVSPRFLYSFVKYIRDSNNNVIKSLKYILSVSFSIWATYKLILLVFDSSVSSKQTIMDVLREFFKSLVAS